MQQTYVAVVAEAPLKLHQHRSRQVAPLAVELLAVRIFVAYMLQSQAGRKTRLVRHRLLLIAPVAVALCILTSQQNPLQHLRMPVAVALIAAVAHHPRL